MRPEELRHYARDHLQLDPKTEAALETEKGQNALKRMQAKARSALRQDTGGKPVAAPPGIGRSDYEAVSDWLHISTYSALKDHPGFKAHSAYVIDCPKYIVDSERDQIVYMLTSEKMLKNIFLQEESGMRRIWCIDTTHRLVAEGHSVMVVGLRDIEQKFHKVAYGVVSSDNQEHTELCLRMVADEYLRVKERCNWSAEELDADADSEPCADSGEESCTDAGEESCADAGDSQDDDSEDEEAERGKKRRRA